jgi:nickel/cobalt transporter (NicO) family protein
MKIALATRVILMLVALLALSSAAFANGDHDSLRELLDSSQYWPAILVSAYVLGALHGLAPGHGKTVVGAYLIGSKGTLWHALLLGLIVTFTHTFSVIILGVVSLLIFNSVVPEQALPWISCISGLLICVVGIDLLRKQMARTAHHHGHHHHGDHDHEHDHGHHDHDHLHHDGPGGHTHTIPEKLTLGGLISLGVSGGLTPCPDAVIVLLSAMALHKLALGLMVLLCFSAGLASILVAIGFTMVLASQIFEKRYPSSITIARISELSYLFVIGMGLFIAIRPFWSH